MDLLNLGIPLGRWFGTRVFLSIWHLVMLAYIASAYREDGPLVMAVIAFVYFMSILLHEFGHVVACRSVGGVADHIVLGPMGGLAMVRPPDRPFPHFVTTAGGPLVNAILWAIFWGILHSKALNPIFETGSTLSIVLWFFFRGMMVINELLLIFNLLPIFPMDGGRLLQNILWPTVGYRESLRFTGMIGTVGGVGLAVLGLGLWEVKIPYVDFSMGGQGNYNTFLLIIGINCAMASWGLYQRAKEMQGWRKN